MVCGLKDCEDDTVIFDRFPSFIPGVKLQVVSSVVDVINSGTVLLSLWYWYWSWSWSSQFFAFFNMATDSPAD